MADAIGLIASLLALIATTIEGIKLAKTLYRAPEELISVQSELEHFNIIVQQINTTHPPLDPSGIIGLSIARSKAAIEKLQDLVNTKLLKYERGWWSRKISRGAWARHKSKVYELRELLRESRHALTTALSAVSSSSALRSETALSTISESTSQIQATTSTINNTLQKQISLTQRTMDEMIHLDGSTAPTQTTTSTISDTMQQQNLLQRAVDEMTHRILDELRIGFTQQNQLTRLSMHFNEALRQVNPENLEVAATVSDEGNKKYSEKQRTSNPLFGINGSLRQTPVSAFEVSSDFFPELYTPNPRPGLRGRVKLILMTEYSTTNSFRIDRYVLKYAVTARKWRSVKIYLSIGLDSIYYGITRVSKSFRALGTAEIIPALLENQFENILAITDLLDDNTSMSLQVLDSSSGPILQENGESKRILDGEQQRFASDFMNYIQDLGCPQFFESEVVQLHQSSNESICYLSNGTLCAEIPAEARDPSKTNTLHIMQRVKTLYTCRGLPGVLQFMGVVVDDRRTHVRGWLHSTPIRSTILQKFIDAHKLGETVPWSKCERWAYQIVEAVAGVHSAGNVIGSLGFFFQAPPALDFQDNAILLAYDCSRSTMNNEKGLLPSEYRSSGQNPSPSNTTTRVDLFQLGLLLWNLAEQHCAAFYGNPFCRKVGCTNASNDIQNCCSSHSNPIQLPAFSDKIPAYYQQLVDICRSEDPNDRWPAKKLLTLFSSSAYAADTSHCAHLLSADVGDFTFQATIGCDHCGVISHSMIHYHCNVCLEGDFDMCTSCVERGLHCQDEEHFLEERRVHDGIKTSTKRYHAKRTTAGELKDTVIQL